MEITGKSKKIRVNLRKSWKFLHLDMEVVGSPGGPASFLDVTNSLEALVNPASADFAEISCKLGGIRRDFPENPVFSDAIHRKIQKIRKLQKLRRTLLQSP